MSIQEFEVNINFDSSIEKDGADRHCGMDLPSEGVGLKIARSWYETGVINYARSALAIVIEKNAEAS